MSSPSFHVGLLPNRPISEVANIAAYSEELGFDGVWIADSQVVFRDAYSALTLAAARTQRIKLATGVTNPITRHASVLASSFATLDELSGGRAVVGIGVGESAIYNAGLRRARLRDVAEVALAIRGLIRGEKAVVGGHEVELAWSCRDVPVFIASTGPRSLQLAGSVADGVLCQAGADPAVVAYALDDVRTGMRAAGRKDGDLLIYSRLACSVDEDREWARSEALGYVAAAAGTVFAATPPERLPADLARDLKRMKETYDYREHTSSTAGHTRLVTDRIVDSLSVSGRPDEVVPRLRGLIQLGIDGFVIPITGSDPERSMRTLAEQVIPQVVSHDPAAPAG